MAKKPLTDFCLRITDPVTMARTYISRIKGAVHYYNGQETPLALANLVGKDAAELRLALSRAPTNKYAAQDVQMFLEKKYKNATVPAPTVEIL